MPEIANSRRASYTAGLRILADAIDKHPELPLPAGGDLDPLTFHFLSGEDPRAAMAAAARALPCSLRKNAPGDKYHDTYLDLDGELAGLKVKLVAYREAVCERVVTGRREVIETVQDPEALAAVPEIEVTKIIEDVEWRCHSLLAPAALDAEATA